MCDWGNDEQPTPMRVKVRRMLVPYELGINDIRVFTRENHTPGSITEWCAIISTRYIRIVSGGHVLCRRSSLCRHALHQVFGKSAGVHLFA